MPLLALGTLALSGCSGSDELNTPTAARLRGIATYYLDLTFARNGKGPANEHELKRHLRKQERTDLISNGIDPQTIDSTLFVSERDQEPFVVRYGQSITRISADSAPLVAYEKTGKDGKRIAVLANSKLRLVDEAGLQAQVPLQPVRPFPGDVGHAISISLATTWIHADRTLGSHRHHRRADRPAVAGRAKSP